MIAALMGVPGKLKTLIDRLTSTRAGNLDNLDAAISTRAAASTALSSSTWTGTLATNLGTISTGASAFTGIVNSIQYATATLTTTDTTATATVTSVNTAKTIVIPAGLTTGSSPAQVDGQVRWTLTNSTTVTATRGGSPTKNCTAGAWVVEFK